MHKDLASGSSMGVLVEAWLWWVACELLDAIAAFRLSGRQAHAVAHAPPSA